MSRTRVQIQINGERRDVSVERIDSDEARFRVSWDGVAHVVDARSIDVQTLSLVLVDSGGASYRVRCESTDRGGGVVAHIGALRVPLHVETGRIALTGRGGRETAALGGQHVSAPMPGKVVRLLVETGDEVEANQGVVVVEAMKMENELTAPRAGRVTAIHVTEGDSVVTGRALVDIEKV